LQIRRNLSIIIKNLQKSHLERVIFRTQSQHFQATDQKFQPYSWETDSP
jgi:hypothetical protein